MSDRFVLIGHPVGHSVSPAIHHAAYEQLGRTACYELADCPDERAVQRRIAEISSGQLRGANVTVPWKRLAYDLADVVAPSAEKVGVANVLARDHHGRVVAHNTDATALCEELERAFSLSGFPSAERTSAIVIGNGGAARAAVVACQLAGILDVAVTARRFTSELATEQWAHGHEFVALGASLLSWPTQAPDEFRNRAQGACLLVQATSAGMKGTVGGDEIADLVPWRDFAPGVAYDLVYNPPRTPFLERAEGAGCRAVGGLGMLVGQAAHAIELWWAERPMTGPLMVAAQKALSL